MKTKIGDFSKTNKIR